MASEEDKAEREAAEQRLRDMVGDLIRSTGHDTPQGAAFLMGFTLITEWKAPDGVRWLAETHADANGDPLPEWTTAGYYTSALDGWPEEEDGEDE